MEGSPPSNPAAGSRRLRGRQGSSGGGDWRLKGRRFGEGREQGREGGTERWLGGGAGGRAGGPLQLPPASPGLQATGQTQRGAIHSGAARGRWSPGPGPEPRAPSERRWRLAPAGPRTRRRQEGSRRPASCERADLLGESFPRGWELARGRAAAAESDSCFSEEGSLPGTASPALGTWMSDPDPLSAPQTAALISGSNNLEMSRNTFAGTRV
ncbi:zinc finger X-linked protein ZXDB-like [Sturnira hondurensis]|uniref:zinc finger X-linked protein ZXDB-like n=1 Tax=Sturnira hondurensis TaxID=192404 RepID=UPI0018792323|nr:zinc finger X-linked protein ZXDB-like [Sturnira hondurensis]